MNFELGYDETSPASIEKFAKGLIGKTFAEVCAEDTLHRAEVVKEISNYEASHGNKKRKGGLGELIEERYFHYRSNNDSRPDFDKAGVELKVTPYKKNRNGRVVAKERLIITMIDYFSVINEKFEDSHLWSKAKLILLVYYLYSKEVTDRLNYKIGYVQLFSPPEQDIKIIKHDYQVILDKIKAGKAHELSESDTLYLGAAPKASTSQDRRKQPFSDELAKPRAFAFKSSYMTYVLNNYIIPEKSTYESIIRNTPVESFEDYVTAKIGEYCGWTVQKLCSRFHIYFEKKPKNLESMIAYRILGIKGNHAAEFEKANIVVKTIRIGKNNTIKESMSFPTFKFNELVKEEWETSTFRTYLEETRFLFVVYKFNDDSELVLKGCQFWNIPYADLEHQVYRVWEKTKQVINNGLQVKRINGKNYNNFPKASENPICHVRPHAQNAQDTYELPDGRKYPKQCFWLNNSYIIKQIDDKLIY